MPRLTDDQIKRRLKAKFGSRSSRTGGKGAARRKYKAASKSSTQDDKRLHSQLKRLNVSSIPAIEEVNLFKQDGTVVHFTKPKVQAEIASNTYVVSGQHETKKLEELIPQILPQLGGESMEKLKQFANAMGDTNQLLGDEEVPQLVDENFEEVSRRDEKSEETDDNTKTNTDANTNASTNKTETTTETETVNASSNQTETETSKDAEKEKEKEKPKEAESTDDTLQSAATVEKATEKTTEKVTKKAEASAETTQEETDDKKEEEETQAKAEVETPVEAETQAEASKEEKPKEEPKEEKPKVEEPKETVAEQTQEPAEPVSLA